MGRIAFIVLTILGVVGVAGIFLGMEHGQSDCLSARNLAVSNLEQAIDSIGRMRETGVPVTAKSLTTLLKQYRWESGSVRYDLTVAWNGGDAGSGWVIWATPEVSQAQGYRILTSWQPTELPRYCVRSTAMEVAQTPWWTALHDR